MTMVLKPDQQHIKDLLTETITLLCCNGLHFKSEFSIDALIGITLDQNEVFLISIKETFQNDRSGVSRKRFIPPVPNKNSSSKSFSCSGAIPSQSLAINDGSGFKDDPHMADGEAVEDRSVRDYSQQNHGKTPFCIGSPKQLGNKRKHRMPLKFANSDSADCYAQDHSLDKQTTVKRRMLDTSTVLVSEDKSEIDNRERHSVGGADCLENSFADTNTQYENDSADNPAVFSRQDFVQHESNANHETCEKDELCNDSDNELVFIKQEPVEKSLMPAKKGNNLSNSGQCANEEFNYRSQQGLSFSPAVHSMQSVFLQLPDPAGCSSWSFPEMSNNVQMSFANRHRWHLEPVEPQLSEKEVETLSQDSVPLSAEELAIARAILSMRGNFVSLGCLKANRQSLRSYTREQLIAVMEKISSPLDNALFIGLLYTFGTTRVFFKCPPSEVTSAALSYFGFDPLVYAECYQEPVIVDKNIRDPVSWIEKILDKSPFK